MSCRTVDVEGDELATLSRFRVGFYESMDARADALFELTDAILCAAGPVRCLPELSLVAQHRRGHGGLYDALGRGRLDVARLRERLAALPLPRTEQRGLVLAVDLTCWLRPEAATSAGRVFCHVAGRTKASAQFIPGWSYSFVAALEPGRSSWTALLDVVRVELDDDVMAVTGRQLRELVERLLAAGQWRVGDPDILIVADAGYDAPRLAHVLADLPVEVLARVRSNRVFRLPPASASSQDAGADAPARVSASRGGRPPRHGGDFTLAKADTWPAPQHQTTTNTTRYGIAQARSWDRLHPRLTHRSSWLAHAGRLPIIEGTLIRLQVEHLPGEGEAKPVWLWTSRTGLSAGRVDQRWQMFLRRFDLEHTFRMLKQTLGWSRPKIRTPEAGERWTWLVIAAHTQLRLARRLVEDRPRPWQRRARTGRLTPARVRQGFPNLHPHLAQPAGAPKPSWPGPGRPPGAKNRQRAPRYDVGRRTPRPSSLTALRDQAG